MSILRWSLRHKAAFLAIPLSLVIFGLTIWLGFDRVFSFMPWTVNKLDWRAGAVQTAQHDHGGQVKSDAPSAAPTRAAIQSGKPGSGQSSHMRSRVLEKNSCLTWMKGPSCSCPPLCPTRAVGEALDVIQKQDLAMRAIPEVDSVVGKIGRVESALDPAPLSMVETVVNYLPEYKIDPLTGQRVTDPETGKPVRNWRPHIKSPNDIWKEIINATRLPGTTSAPKLQPIAGRVVMLQSGMRAAMGVKIRGKSLDESREGRDWK